MVSPMGERLRFLYACVCRCFYIHIQVTILSTLERLFFFFYLKQIAT